MTKTKFQHNPQSGNGHLEVLYEGDTKIVNCLTDYARIDYTKDNQILLYHQNELQLKVEKYTGIKDCYMAKASNEAVQVQVSEEFFKKLKTHIVMDDLVEVDDHQ